jgi:hypothetical protein
MCIKALMETQLSGNVKCYLHYVSVVYDCLQIVLGLRKHGCVYSVSSLPIPGDFVFPRIV